MNGDLIIKDVDLDYLKDDLDYLEEVFEDFKEGDSRYEEFIEKAGVRVLGMLKTWAEGRKAEREDEELANALVSEQFPDATRNAAELLKQGALAGLKAQRKRLGK